MTDSSRQPPVDYTPLKRRKRLWTAAAVVIGLCILIPLVYLQVHRPAPAPAPGPAQEALRMRDHLLQIGAALRHYAQENDHALPEHLSAAALRDESGNALDPQALLANPAMSRPITYRIVTPEGEKLRYEPYGDRAVAWTQADGHGRRLVLLNNLEEVLPVTDADLDQHEQRLRSTSALNRVRSAEPANQRE